MRLGAFPVFADLDPAPLAALADLGRETFFRAGATLQRKGVPARDVHYVVEGEVEIRPRSGPAIRVGPLGVINGLSALAGVARSDDVVAVVDTTTLSFTREDQADVFEEHFEILVRVLREAAGAHLDALREDRQDAAAPERPVRPSNRVTSGLASRLAALRAASPFDGAPLEALAELARDAPEARHPAGERLWRAGDDPGWSLAILSGQVAGIVDGGGELAFGPGTAAGVLDTLAGRPRWFDAVAVTDVVGLRIDGGALLDLLEDHADMALRILRSIARDVIALRSARALSAHSAA